MLSVLVSGSGTRRSLEREDQRLSNKIFRSELFSQSRGHIVLLPLTDFPVRYTASAFLERIQSKRIHFVRDSERRILNFLEGIFLFHTRQG